MEVCGKFGFLALLGAFCFLSVGHCADEVDGLTERMPQTARELLQSQLFKSGATLGYDDECKAVTTIGLQHFCDKDVDDKSSYDVYKEYDFKDELTDRFETRRVKAVWRAYANAVCNAAEVVLGACSASRKQDRVQSDCLDTGIASVGKQKLDSVRVLTSAVSARLVGGKMCFEEAIAVRVHLAPCHSVKPGDKTLREWLDSLKDNMTIGPASFCDASGCVWNIGIVPVEEIDVQSEKGTVSKEAQRAKIFAYEIASRVGRVSVDWHRSAAERMSEKVKYKQSVHILPFNAPRMADASRVKWFSVVGTDCFTSKKIRKFVCAIREVGLMGARGL